MILRDLLDYFDIHESLPDYLLEQTFNDVFLDGQFTINDGSYEIVVTTRQDVTHMMFIRPGDEFPVMIMSELPNGKLNGMKFHETESDGIVIDRL